MSDLSTPSLPGMPPPLPALVDDGKRGYFLRKSGQGIFTGEGLRHADPARYAKIVQLLADGSLSQRDIAEVCSVAAGTIRAIARAQEGAILALREDLARDSAELERATLDRIRERLDDEEAIPLRDLAAILREIGNRHDILAGRARPADLHLHLAAGTDDVARANAERRARMRDLAAQRAGAVDASYSMTSQSGDDSATPAAIHLEEQNASPREDGAQSDGPVEGLT